MGGFALITRTNRKKTRMTEKPIEGIYNVIR